MLNFRVKKFKNVHEFHLIKTKVPAIFELGLVDLSYSHSTLEIDT